MQDQLFAGRYIPVLQRYINKIKKKSFISHHFIVNCSPVGFSELLVYQRPKRLDNVCSPELFRYFKTAESKKKKKRQRKRWRTELKTVYSYHVCILKTGNCLVGTFFIVVFQVKKIPTTVKVLVRAILLGASTAGSRRTMEGESSRALTA